MLEIVIVSLSLLVFVLLLGLFRERRLRVALQALLTRLLKFQKGRP